MQKIKNIHRVDPEKICHRQTNRQIGRQTSRQADRQTERWADEQD